MIFFSLLIVQNNLKSCFELSFKLEKFCSQKIFLKCLLKSERLIEVIEHKIIASIEILAFKIGSKIRIKAAESWNKLYEEFKFLF